MVKHCKIFLIVLASLSLLWACKPEETHITVSSKQLVGKWAKTNSQEYWRYREDGTGVTWDEAEEITEEISNLTFTWTIKTDVLTHVFSGAEGNQAVPKVYTITSISSSSMVWEDDYGTKTTLRKVNEEQ